MKSQNHRDVTPESWRIINSSETLFEFVRNILSLVYYFIIDEGPFNRYLTTTEIAYRRG
jgi:hypothetical protein